MAVGLHFTGKIIVDEDEGSIYLPPQLKKYLDQKFGVLTWSHVWFPEEIEDEHSSSL